MSSCATSSSSVRAGRPDGALYTGARQPQAAVIEGLEAGGQLMMTTLVENWPGYRNGIDGPGADGGDARAGRALRRRDHPRQVTDVDVSRHPFTVTTSDGRYTSRTLIIATGASARLLGCRRSAR
jgi:thioredoxin reductase (NADPH)